MNTRARIATVCQAGRISATAQENRRNMLGLLDIALSQKPDLVCLPETFTLTHSVTSMDQIAEPVDGPTIQEVSRRARENRCYVICPINTKRDGAIWNSAVVVGRDGKIVGIYDKIHPVTTSHDYSVFESGTAPGAKPVTFDLDFGRIGIQICFDVGFPENWQKLADEGVRLVVWSSAYNGGVPLQTFAALHNYYIVSSVRSAGSRVIDPCGNVLAETDSLTNVVWRDINLDYMVCHTDFNYAIPDRINAKYGGRVKLQTDTNSGWLLVEPLDASITIEQLQREFGFESRAQYHQRHRKAHQAMVRGEASAPQSALHGNRSMYSKS